MPNVRDRIREWAAYQALAWTVRQETVEATAQMLGARWKKDELDEWGLIRARCPRFWDSLPAKFKRAYYMIYRTWCHHQIYGGGSAYNRKSEHVRPKVSVPIDYEPMEMVSIEHARHELNRLTGDNNERNASGIVEGAHHEPGERAV